MTGKLIKYVAMWLRLMHMDGNVGFDFMRSADGTASFNGY